MIYFYIWLIGFIVSLGAFTYYDARKLSRYEPEVSNIAIVSVFWPMTALGLSLFFPLRKLRELGLKHREWDELPQAEKDRQTFNKSVRNTLK